MAVGACGFFVAVYDVVPMGMTTDGFQTTRSVPHIYAVTNDHNIKNGSCVMRVNTVDGDIDVVPLKPSDWTPHPDGDDLSVSRVSLGNEHRWRAVHDHMLISQNDDIDQTIGYGDDVFMVGRFVTHDGLQQNNPVMRFGNIAMLPLEPVCVDARGDFMQDTFLVDMRSVSGFSGSPVFTYKLGVRPNDVLNRRPGPAGSRVHLTIDDDDLKLLGIEYWAFHVPGGHLSGLRQSVSPSNSGMSGVIPAWKLYDLLHIPALTTTRRKDSLRYLSEHQSSGELC